MFLIEKGYLTPKGRLGNKTLAYSPTAKVRVIANSTVSVEFEGQDGEAYTLHMSQPDAQRLRSAIAEALGAAQAKPNQLVVEAVTRA